MKILILIPMIWSTTLLGNMQDALKRFDTYAEEQRLAWEVPGMAVAVIKEEEVVFLKGYGQRGLDDKRLVDADTIFQIGSISKSFTSGLVAIGKEKGWLEWDDKVLKHDQTFRMSDPWVTAEFEIQDLLAQRSGLPAYAGDIQTFLGFSEEEILTHLRFLKPVTSFRSSFAYQNVFFSEAARILEKESGMKFDALMKKEIFEPLEMKKTTLGLDNFLKEENRAQWLMRKGNKTEVLPEDFTYRNWNYIYGPAGGINSCARDLANWLVFQANSGTFKGNQLVEISEMERMTRPMVYAGTNWGFSMYYALGWVHLSYSPHPIIWHDGSTLGVFNAAGFIPQEKIGIVILTNVRNTTLAMGLMMQFFDYYYGKEDQKWSQKLLEKANEKKTEELIANPYPPMAFNYYEGRYSNPVYGEVVVKNENDQLVMVISGRSPKLVLKPWTRDIFTYIWPLAEDGTGKVLFGLDENGVVNRLVIESFEKTGSGEFVRNSSKEGG